MAITKVVFVPKRTAPIDQAVYYVETNNYNVAEYKAIQQLRKDNLDPKRYKRVDMASIEIIKVI